MQIIENTFFLFQFYGIKIETESCTFIRPINPLQKLSQHDCIT
jgi:hypothetical protein